MIYASVTKALRNSRADSASRRSITFVDLPKASPVIVMPAMMFVSVDPAPRKFGPPESP